QFVPAVSVYIDLPLFMKYLAVQSFLAEWDGTLGYAGVNNFFLYRFEDSLRSQWIPWDEDNTFRAVDYPILPGLELNVLVRRAMNVPELRAAYIAGLQAATALSGWMEGEVQLERALISGS